MFDVGFSELMVIALVALIVIGPERLPKVARTAGLLLGRLQRYVSDVKADISREMQLEELKHLQSQINEQAKALEESVTQQMKEAESSLNEAVAAPVAEVAAEAQAALPDAKPETAAETLPEAKSVATAESSKVQG